MTSLQNRFTKSTIVSLVVFSLLLAFVLDRVFHRTLIVSEESRLKGLVYALLSAMDIDDQGNVRIDEGQLPKFFIEIGETSLMVLNEKNDVLWSNDSQPNVLLTSIHPTTGEWIFNPPNKTHDRMELGFGFAWVNENKGEWTYTMVIRDSGRLYRGEMKHFRNTLWTWLSLGCATLLLLQLLLVKWGFQPLQSIAVEVSQIEQGQKHRFEESYPAELLPLVGGVNSLLRHERSQQIRYRQSLDNLAHAIKTPLTAIKNLAMQKVSIETLHHDLNEQVKRIRDIIDYQLRKAAVSEKNPFAKPILIHEVVEKVSRSVQKVYSNKNLQIDVQIPEDSKVSMDEGDLYEVVGNIVENAAKYCNQKMKIQFQNQERPVLMVEDDGPGFSDEKIQSLIQRGVRQDQRTEGSGIGLSVAFEIISVFGGSLELTRSSALSGALVKVYFS